MVKKLVGCLLVLSLAVPVAAQNVTGNALTLGLGGQDGHSEKSSYSVGKGWAGFLRYERFYSQDISYGFHSILYTWEKAPSHELRGRDKLGTYTGIEGTLYLYRIKTLEFFVKTGAGAEVNGDGARPALYVGYGIGEQISKDYSIELCAGHTFSTGERHDFFTAGLKYRF